MKKTASRKGIALVSMAIIILILLLFAGVVTYVSNDIIDESKKTAFAKDIAVIYEAAQEYYAVNGDIPSLNDGVVMDFETYKSETINAKYLQVLEEEVVKNNDEQSIFYEIDMTKIGVDTSKYGTKQTEDDIYLISNLTQNVYYFPGIKINKNIYFSDINIVEK